RRALRVTWKRLSEAPKTSGRGNLQIMEKIFDRLIEQEPTIMSVFYRSAFIKCIEDRKKRCPYGTGKSVTTLRDHAHLLIDFIDGILNVMFEQPLTKPVWDPLSIGKLHSKLMPLGFERQIWLKLGECFAEVMFSQECIRAYPHAASAWSLLAVSCTDKMYTSGRAQPVWDPLSIGKLHSKLMPLGFERQIWLKLGECFAEVMFSQECIRAYPHAASAWSLLAVSCTDKMYTSGRAQRSFDTPFPKLQHSMTSMSLTCPISSQTPTTESSASSSSARSLQHSPSKSHSEDSSTTSSAPPNTIRLTAASSLASFF
uniref:Globin family profile domain-containing protein n=1 Tax=Panagrolaimus sp. ES5 TaxID=591445 RepID=A0AC34GB17_9BILA